MSTPHPIPEATARLVERVRDLLHKREGAGNTYDGRFRFRTLDGGYSCTLTNHQYSELRQLLADHDASVADDTQPRPIHFVVELDEGVWIAPWSGDPGRTLVRSNARGFATRAAADEALTAARKYRPFRNARVVPAPTSSETPA